MPNGTQDIGSIYRTYSQALLRQMGGDHLADRIAPMDDHWHWRAVNMALGLRDGWLTEAQLDAVKGDADALDALLQAAAA